MNYLKGLASQLRERAITLLYWLDFGLVLSRGQRVGLSGGLVTVKLLSDGFIDQHRHLGFLHKCEMQFVEVNTT